MEELRALPGKDKEMKENNLIEQIKIVKNIKDYLLIQSNMRE